MERTLITWRSLLGLGLAVLVSSAQAREFTNREGQKMEAEPVSIADGKVLFEKAGGRKFSYDLDQLCDEDQAFLKEWVKTSMKYDIEITRAQAVQFDAVRSREAGTNIKVESRGYEVFVKNTSRTTVENIVCTYALFPKFSDKYAEERHTVGMATKGKVTLKPIPGVSEVSFQTKPVRLESGTSVTATTISKWRESLDGGNFNFYVGDRLIASHNIGGYKAEGAPTPDEVKDDSGKEPDEDEEDEEEDDES